LGFEPGLKGLERSPTSGGTMRSLLVVVDAEGVQLHLQVSQIFRRRLALQVALERLMEALDFAAGLGAYLEA
jgi:hypothetical protein